MPAARHDDDDDDTTSSIYTKMIYVSLLWSVSTGISICMSRQENVIYECVRTSLL